MSKVVVIVTNKDFLIYDEKLNIKQSIEDDDQIFVVLPDDYFFFFQTDITAKKNTSKAVDAYAKTLFPVDGFVGYVKKNYPVVGYIFDKKRLRERERELIKRAKYITSPFLINYLKNTDFLYCGNNICACVEHNAIKFYSLGDEHTLNERKLSPGIKVIDFHGKKIASDLFEIKNSRELSQLSLDIGQEGQFKFRNWKVSRFVYLIVVLLFIIAGNILIYQRYIKELNYYKKRLDNLYKQALNGKIYLDPYGVLLYKAEQGHEINGISPLKLVYSLSKSKNNYNLSIEYISFIENTFTIRGNIDSYKNLVGYVKGINKILSKDFFIKSTSSKKKGLSFVIGLNENG